MLRRKHFRSRVWVPTVKAAGFEDLTFHGLRHSAAGLMIELGTHPRTMQKRLGHSSFRTTMDVYGSVLESVDNEVIDGLDGLLAGSDDEPESATAEMSRGLPAVSADDELSRRRTKNVVTRENSGGAEGSRTPGLLDATEAL